VADRAAAQGVALGYPVEGDVPHGMHGDELRFRQVPGNLLGNAVEFTDAGSVQAVLAFRAESRLLEVRVRDTGPGIAQSTLRHLFQPFSQVDGAATRRHGGTGLGLAISRQRVELMGGGIGGATQAGQGPQFNFTVGWRAPLDPASLPDPLARLSGRRIAAFGLDPLQQGQRRSRGSVLEAVDAASIDSVLETVDAASRGSAAAEGDGSASPHTAAPDLILVGSELPDPAGFAGRLGGRRTGPRAAPRRSRPFATRRLEHRPPAPAGGKAVAERVGQRVLERIHRG
jgi:hypothetical protein